MTPDNWTVSLDAEGKTWGAYRNGRLILAGYERSTDARWSIQFLERGKVPPYVPERLHAEVLARLQ